MTLHEKNVLLKEKQLNVLFLIELNKYHLLNFFTKCLVGKSSPRFYRAFP